MSSEQTGTIGTSIRRVGVLIAAVLSAGLLSGCGEGLVVGTNPGLLPEAGNNYPVSGGGRADRDQERVHSRSASAQ